MKDAFDSTKGLSYCNTAIVGIDVPANITFFCFVLFCFSECTMKSYPVFLNKDTGNQIPQNRIQSPRKVTEKQ